MATDVLERWLEALLATPEVTAIRDPDEARRMLVSDALRAAELVSSAPPGAVIDVGSGGGSPGIPLAAAIPEREFVLLDSQRRRCEFLREVTGSLRNVEVVWVARRRSRPTCSPLRSRRRSPSRRSPRSSVSRSSSAAGSRSCGRGRRRPGGRGRGCGARRGRGRVGAGRVARAAKGTRDTRGLPRRPGMAKKRPLA